MIKLLKKLFGKKPKTFSPDQVLHPDENMRMLVALAANTGSIVIGNIDANGKMTMQELDNPMKKRWVVWNQEVDGFQQNWIWQFGPGPFEIIEEFHTPTKPTVFGRDMSGMIVEMPFEQGRLWRIKIPQAAHQYRSEYGVMHATFHEKWLKQV